MATNGQLRFPSASPPRKALRLTPEESTLVLTEQLASGPHAEKRSTPYTKRKSNEPSSDVQPIAYAQ
jgi:hypothetical protein